MYIWTVWSIFTDHVVHFFCRSQLLRLRVAKEMVRFEQSDILLLWEWKRFVWNVSVQKLYRFCELHQIAFLACFVLLADKQQKGSLYISDYSVQLVTNLRKDSLKKNSCFELFAPGRRSFQVCIATTSPCR